MRYIYIVLFSAMLFRSVLHAQESSLGDILQTSKEVKPLKPAKKQSKKEKQTISHYTFTFEKDLEKTKEKPQQFNYKNRSRFEFKFTNEPSQGNLVGGSVFSGAGGSGGNGNGNGGGRGGR